MQVNLVKESVYVYTASQHTWQNDALCLSVSGYDIISEAI